MEGLRQHALSVVTGAVICAVVLSVVGDSSHSKRIRMLCSIYLGILVLKPLAGQNWDFDRILPEISFAEAEIQSACGEEMARKAAAEIISERVQAYILDKAALSDTDLTVFVSVGEDLLPVAVQLYGSVTDREKALLSQILEEDLGISKENQQWTG